MKVAIGSDNPVKVNAVKSAFKAVWPAKKFEFKSTKVSSGVSVQPKSDKESIKGARKRAREAKKLLKAGFGVGLEGGLQKIENNWYDCGWIVVVDETGNEGIASSIKMLTPRKMIKLLKKYKELGSVDDYIFKRKNSKQKLGHFGLMTNGLIDRKKGYKDAVISALSRFIHPELF